MNKQPTIEHLKFIQGWMKHMSKPGPKVSINGKPQPFPEESRLKCEKQLERVNRLIAEIEGGE